MAKVLLAGESWISAVVDHKDYDAFPHTQVHIGCARLLEALAAEGHEVTHLRSHDVAADFPLTLEELGGYDVVILSDIGANSLLLPPQVFEEGKKAPNRLKLLREWVAAGGGLMMAGGYLSFQGFQAKANYHDTAVEEVLPVTILPYDDRVETPEGCRDRRRPPDHRRPGRDVARDPRLPEAHAPRRRAGAGRGRGQAAARRARVWEGPHAHLRLGHLPTLGP